MGTTSLVSQILGHFLVDKSCAWVCSVDKGIWGESPTAAASYLLPLFLCGSEWPSPCRGNFEAAMLWITAALDLWWEQHLVSGMVLLFILTFFFLSFPFAIPFRLCSSGWCFYYWMWPHSGLDGCLTAINLCCFLYSAKMILFLHDLIFTLPVFSLSLIQTLLCPYSSLLELECLCYTTVYSKYLNFFFDFYRGSLLQSLP